MDSELKDLNPNSQDNHQRQETAVDEGNRPLLKRDTLLSDEQQLPYPSTPSKLTTAAELEEMEKKFAAYVRNDAYGPMGRGVVPMTEKLLLGIAMVILVPLRVLFGMTILIIYYLICKACTFYSTPNRSGEEGQLQQEDYAHLGGWRRDIIVMSGRFLARAILFTFGFYWIPESYRLPEESNNHSKLSDQRECRGGMEEPERPGVVISNHVSYLDILYHMSSSFPSFVAKRSVGKLPLVGLISKCLGCVYVQREDKSSDFKGVSGAVTERIKDAHENNNAPMMLIFPAKWCTKLAALLILVKLHFVVATIHAIFISVIPKNLSYLAFELEPLWHLEGTTTNGDFLLPFKTGAFIAGAPVLPMILRYPYHRFSPAWDSISGVRHVILLLCQFVNYMEVTKLPIYYPSKEEKGDPKLYATNVRKLMAAEGNLILTDIGLPEKRIYHAALNGNNSLHSVSRQKSD